jgi:hypothetical protein
VLFRSDAVALLQPGDWMAKIDLDRSVSYMAAVDLLGLF